jgi:hypothetical protein
MKRYRKIVLCLFILLTGHVFGQLKSLQYAVELTGVGSTGQFSPFWFQSKEFGRISQHPNALNFNFELLKPYQVPEKKFEIAYGFKLNPVVILNGKTSLYLQEAYFDARWHILDLSLGMKERKNLITDNALSTGDLLISQNSRPIPQIRAGIEDFTAIPFTKGLIEIRGAVAHGWFADGVFAPGIMFHHKFAHVKLGGEWPVRLQYGFEHVAEWGGNIPGNGDQSFTFNRLINVFFARQGDNHSNEVEQINAIGNHIVSTHLKLESKIGNYEVNASWINMFEDHPVKLFPWLARNKYDGLWTISIRNKKLPVVQGFTYEYLNTLDDGGPLHFKDGIVYGGMYTYFRNVIYKNGWTHFGRTIGNPLLLSPVFNADGNIQIVYNYIRAHHFGLDGNIAGFRYKFLTTFSSYYINNLNPAHKNVFWMIEAGKKLPELEDMELTVKIGGNAGDIPGNTTGLMISIRKAGILFPK